MNLDPAALTASALIAKWAVEGVAKSAGKSAWSGIQKVYDFVRTRLGGHDTAALALESVEQQPTEQKLTQELAEELDRLMKSDTTFADQLRQLVDEAVQVGEFVVEVRDNAKIGNINIFKQTENVTQNIDVRM